MTDFDIVGELRRSESNPYIPEHAWWLMRGAAAEIERLRGEIDYLNGVNDD